MKCREAPFSFSTMCRAHDTQSLVVCVLKLSKATRKILSQSTSENDEEKENAEIKVSFQECSSMIKYECYNTTCPLYTILPQIKLSKEILFRFHWRLINSLLPPRFPFHRPEPSVSSLP